ncbi:MAG TPA: asparagine synthase C-terminal domain-containing protein, partial [Verrucomicrobiota bacterium]|nr:asparagine synthase C-terminal domain-containing protein [Verrucomicrobiota bacterium]
LANGFINAPRSIFRSVRKVPPGHFLTVDASGQIDLQCYWKPELKPASDWRAEPPAELARQLRTELETAVRLRMISDVPLGAFLSGGLDSSAVVALMSQMSSHRVRTFSIGFADDPNDETPYSALMARHVNSDHTHEVVSAAQLAEVAPTLAAHFDEPFADDSMVPTWFVSKLARQSVTVALSGDGGDEVFGGYTWYRRAWRQARLEAAIPAAFRPLAKAFGSKLPSKYAAYFTGLDAPPSTWRLRSPYFDTAGRLAMYRADFRSVLGSSDADVSRGSILKAAQELPLLSQLQTLDLAGYLPGDILVKVDRVSMKESLEARCPLLDHIVFEFMANVPPDLKLNARGSKWLFQQAVADLLPPAIWQRQKRGFDVPLATWFAGPLRPLVDELRESNSLKLHQWLDPASVRSVLGKAGSGTSGDAGRVWALICLELWARSL